MEWYLCPEAPAARPSSLPPPQRKAPPSLTCPAPGFLPFQTLQWPLPHGSCHLWVWVTVWLPQEADRQQELRVGKSCVFIFCVLSGLSQGEPREAISPPRHGTEGHKSQASGGLHLAAPPGPGEHVSQKKWEC